MRRFPHVVAVAVLSVGLLAGCTLAPPAPPAVPAYVSDSTDKGSQPPDPADPNAPTDNAASAGGSWQGYRTWNWTGGKWVATWTWVWVPAGGTFQTS